MIGLASSHVLYKLTERKYRTQMRFQSSLCRRPSVLIQPLLVIGVQAEPTFEVQEIEQRADSVDLEYGEPAVSRSISRGA